MSLCIDIRTVDIKSTLCYNILHPIYCESYAWSASYAYLSIIVTLMLLLLLYAVVEIKRGLSYSLVKTKKYRYLKYIM